MGPIIVSVLHHSVGSLIAIIRSKKGDKRVFLEYTKKPTKSKDLIKLLKTFSPEWLDGVKFTRKKSFLFVQDLIDYEKSQTVKKVKIGILYSKQGQTTEEQMYNNGERFFFEKYTLFFYY